MSSTLIVPVAVVDSVSPHPNADKLAIARILGWQSLSPKDNIGLAKRSCTSHLIRSCPKRSVLASASRSI